MRITWNMWLVHQTDITVTGSFTGVSSYICTCHVMRCSLCRFITASPLKFWYLHCLFMPNSHWQLWIYWNNKIGVFLTLYEGMAWKNFLWVNFRSDFCRALPPHQKILATPLTCYRYLTHSLRNPFTAKFYSEALIHQFEPGIKLVFLASKYCLPKKLESNIWPIM